ncbi:uncharacterized protein PV09_08572 [Verruconis gallopava]|uniref:DSBA-like thioredoxin domain-containing protein n=1 Tax=Verruconis gallopava TaxID=253628 RepID=A0A0D1YG63_9PEZI|nr:uncharacterized protein PV09_08572 [Verruconis gallopava]KIV99766.1 hypothetical protein PV09_08572 [Verruconis gallopava]
MNKWLKTQPPWEVPNRVRWIENDLRRSAPYAGLEWKAGWPRDFPLRTTTGVQRALVACSLVCPDRLPEVVAALYHAFWVEKEAVQRPEISLPVIGDVVGESLAREIAQKSITIAVRDKLASNTDEALRDGACGLPWLKCTTADGSRTESFWGFDHIGQVADFLGLPAPMEDESMRN